MNPHDLVHHTSVPSHESPVTAVLCATGGLPLLRCLINPRIPTLVVSPVFNDYTFYSRYCQQRAVIASPWSEPAQAIQDLIEIGKGLSDKPVLYYGDDATLLAISRNRDRLQRYYRFLLPEPELVENLVDKLRFSSLAERLGFPIPKTHTPSPLKVMDEVRKDFPIPCILKPNTHIDWYEFLSQVSTDSGWRHGKVLCARNLEEFEILYERIKGFKDGFVIQPYIPGGEDCIYSFHAYFDRRSEPLGYFVGRKIRTYPKECGESTYLELVREPELVRISLEILKALCFVGPVKIDFKKDIDKNCFYLLEINARFTLWCVLGARCGINLPQLAHADLHGQSCQPLTEYRTGVRWLSFGKDFRAFIQDYHPDGDLSWIAWLLSYKCPKVYGLFSWSDPYPLFIHLLNYLKLIRGGSLSRLRKLFASGSNARGREPLAKTPIQGKDK